MYQDLIRSELNEAAEVLNKFLSDDHNIAQIEAAAKMIADSFKQDGKCYRAVTVVLTVTLCTLQKS